MTLVNQTAGQLNDETPRDRRAVHSSAFSPNLSRRWHRGERRRLRPWAGALNTVGVVGSIPWRSRFTNIGEL